MLTRLYNARILTMVENQSIFTGEIWVRDSFIEKVISYQNQAERDCATGKNFDEQIDCMGNLLMPGFKNCHAHGPMTFLRSYADDLPLQEWLNEKIFPAEAKLKPEDITVLMQLAILEYIRGGITTSFEMYFYPEMIAKAAEEMKYRLVISGTVFGQSANEVEDAIHTLKQDYDLLYNYSDLVSYRLGFHSEYSCCKELLKAIGNLANELKAPVYMHNSETEKEVAECKKRHGMSPVGIMNECGIFNYGGAGHHMLFTDDSDCEIMKEKSIYAVINPSSNLKLASGIAPVKKYLDMNIQLALGTDGPASNNSLNFFKEMYLATCLPKVKYQLANAVAPMDVLRMATVNGANLLGLEECNGIAEHKKADLILIDLLKPNMQPLNHIVDNIVYSGSNENVIMTMINGNILYANGRYNLNMNPIDIYEKANQIIRRIEYI